MLEYKWCLIEIKKNLLDTGWTILYETAAQTKDYKFKTWKIEKNAHQLSIAFYHQISSSPPIYPEDLITYACVIKGTNIRLDFLEYYQKDVWMKLLQRFSESLNYNYNLLNFGGHAIEEMPPQEAIDIAQKYIDNKAKIKAKITGQVQSMGSWDSRSLNHPVWVVYADNLNKGPFIDGVNTYSIVVSTITKTVEDISLM